MSFKVACTVSAVNACDAHFVASAGYFFIFMVIVTVRVFVLAQNRIRFIFVDAFLDFFQEGRELIRVAVEHQFFLHKVDRNVAETLNFCNVSFKIACTVSAVDACDAHFVASAGKFFMFMVMFVTTTTFFAVIVMVIVTATTFFAVFMVMIVTATTFFTVIVVVIVTATAFFAVIVVMIVTATAFLTVIVVMIVTATTFFTVIVVVIVTATAFFAVIVVVYFRSFGFFF